jgi:hypothetical protein
MAYDLVTWAPRVGSSGDDKYNVPGATKLNGFVDSGLPSRIEAGDSSGFSATPSIAEINNSSGLNQVIGLLNRRALRHNALFGTTIPTVAYQAIDERITAAKVAAVNAGISGVITTEGILPTGASLSNPSVGTMMRGTTLANMRKALAISGTLRPHYFQDTVNDVIDWNQYRRIDNPYGSPTSETIGNVFPFQGRAHWEKSGSDYFRRRMITSYRIPEWLTALVSCVYQVNFVASSGSATPITLEMYRMNVGVSGAAMSNSSFYATDNFVHSLATAVPFAQDITTDVTIANGVLTGAAGGYLSFLFGFDIDFLDTGSAFTTARLFNFGSRTTYGPLIDLG